LSAERQPVCCRPKRCGQDHLRLEVPARSGKLPPICQCRSDCRRHVTACAGKGKDCCGPDLPGGNRTPGSDAPGFRIRDHAVRAGYLRLIARLKSTGWRVELIYLALPNVEMSSLRVAERVAHGNHNIPQMRSSDASHAVCVTCSCATLSLSIAPAVT